MWNEAHTLGSQVGKLERIEQHATLGEGASEYGMETVTDDFAKIHWPFMLARKWVANSELQHIEYFRTVSGRPSQRTREQVSDCLLVE